MTKYMWSTLFNQLCCTLYKACTFKRLILVQPVYKLPQSLLLKFLLLFLQCKLLLEVCKLFTEHFVLFIAVLFFYFGNCWGPFKFGHEMTILVDEESKFIVSKGTNSRVIFIVFFYIEIEFAVQLSFMHSPLIEPFR